MLVVVVQGSFEQARDTIEKSVGKADLLEFRLDLFEKNDVQTVSDLHNLAKSACPVMFTLRPISQGGKFAGPELIREQKLNEFLKLSPEYVDLEHGIRPEFVRHVRREFPEVRIVVSYHDFQETPENLSALVQYMTRYSADIYKVACYANSSLDALRMLEFVHKTCHQGIPIAGMSMGQFGEVSRILGPVVGSQLTYAPLDLEGSTAPGQVTVDKLRDTYRFHKLNLHTAIFALLGDPVDKSFGHICHNAVFESENINAIYVKILLRSEELPEFFRLANSLPFKGFSVTMPLKEAVIKHLDQTDYLPETSGAANTLVKMDGKWLGFNTDAKGALDAIEEKTGLDGKTVLILGAGGTAKSIAVEAKRRGAEILISNRTPEKAKGLAILVDGATVNFEVLQSSDHVAHDILINTTSIGMTPVIHALPVAASQLVPGSVVFDAIWNPKKTMLLKMARAKGCSVVYGWEMFIRQALEQQKIWFQGLHRDEKKVLKSLEHVLMSNGGSNDSDSENDNDIGTDELILV